MMSGQTFGREPPPALQVDEVLAQITRDDQEEWEYEYSTTETETYYLTLDLSHPDFKGKRQTITNYSRGGYYKSKATARRANELGQLEAQEPGEDEAGEGGGRDDEDLEEMEARRRAKGKAIDRGSPDRDDSRPEKDRQDHLGEIQILDLHSEHPIVSYRDRIFEGDWSEVIGTEVILTQQDESNPPLPALRRLADGIDLLGASATKIVMTEKILKPIADAEKKEREAALDTVKKEWSIHIPVGKRAKGSGKEQQARFLENLMAVKKKKGETDNVTVYARPAGEDRFAPGKRSRGTGEGTTRRARRGRRRTTAAPRWHRSGVGLDRGRKEGEGSLSTPTPQHWNHMQTPEGQEVDERESEGDVKMSG